MLILKNICPVDTLCTTQEGHLRRLIFLLFIYSINYYSENKHMMQLLKRRGRGETETINYQTLTYSEFPYPGLLTRYATNIVQKYKLISSVYSFTGIIHISRANYEYKITAIPEKFLSGIDSPVNGTWSKQIRKRMYPRSSVQV